MSQTKDAKAILFVTYRIFGNERTMKVVEKELKPKGCEVILKVSKKVMKPDKEADFTEIISEINKALQKT
jgi:hypothetical protein